MRITILLPHYKTKEMTTYSIGKLNEMKGRHDIDIILISNSGTEGLLHDYPDNVQVVIYPENLLQSHGIAFDYAIEQGLVKTEYFITIESDSFPIKDNWLDYYENLINEGYDMAGSLLKLSGGQYIHPCGAMYKLSNWNEAMSDANEMNSLYFYLNNHKRKDGHPFEYHLMQQNILETDEETNKAAHYEPCTKVFHNGMGYLDEDIKTYGYRNIETGVRNFKFPDNPPNFIHRVGYEPGQWFSYWHYFKGKKIKEIPTETVWLPNRRNQQQEYTLNEAGFKHLWGISSYYKADSNPNIQDIIDFKQKQLEQIING